MKCVLALACLGLGLGQQAPAGEAAPDSPQSLIVYPKQVVLVGPRAEQQLVVLGEFSDGHQIDLTQRTKYTVGDPRVARVVAGIIRPSADGTTQLAVRFGDLSSTVPVAVTRARAEIPVDFAREVVPVLTKAGCNQGACHGGQHGRGGFRLSLLGYDPSFDFGQIVQSAEGRRVVVSDPERSVLLLKPSLQMEHGGGERLPVRSDAYNLVRDWLADGAPAPREDAPLVNRLEVWPVMRICHPGEQQQIAVRARWSDGGQADVTANAQYDSLNESVATVSPTGLITAKGRGETHIMIRFSGQAKVVQVTLPYAQLRSYPALAHYNLIDDHLEAKWRTLGLTPSPLCNDAEFIRRVYLDAIGTLPTPDEVRTFLNDRRPDKRRRLSDAILDRPEYVDYWALKLGDLLRINRTQLNEKGMWSFYNWVRASLRDNRPLDEFVRDLVTAEGSTFTDGPANFYRTANNPADWAEATTQLFLGVRMQCARCHHHPFEKWSQDDYYGMSAFFVRLGVKQSQEFGLFERETVIFLRDSGEQVDPRRGKLVKPHPLDGPDMDDAFDRRRRLADWLTAKTNPFFARNLVNRFWGYFMGHGLVEPLDDLRATNPASNPALLDALANDFVQHGFDIKQLMRTIMASRSYQLDSQVADGNRADVDNVYFGRYMLRRLTAEQLADALDFATGTREKYPGLPAGTRAIQLPDTSIRSFFLDVFGRPQRLTTCECERTMEPNIAQALHLLNGDTLNRKIAAPGGRIDKLMKARTAPAPIIEELYLATMSRPPLPEEIAKASRWVSQAASPREGAQDLLWVLLNSREFLFNH